MLGRTGSEAPHTGGPQKGRRWFPWLLLLLPAFGFFGCVHSLQLMTTLDAEQEVPTPPASFFVVVDLESAPAIRKQIASRIEQHLEREGFRILTRPPADYELFFRFGSEKRVLRQSGLPRDPDFLESGSPLPGPAGWAHYLRMAVFDTRKEERPMVWQVGVELSEKNVKNVPDPPELLDLSVVAAFEYFPQNTRNVVRIPLLEAKRIRRGEQ